MIEATLGAGHELGHCRGSAALGAMRRHVAARAPLPPREPLARVMIKARDRFLELALANYQKATGEPFEIADGRKGEAQKMLTDAIRGTVADVVSGTDTDLDAENRFLPAIFARKASTRFVENAGGQMDLKLTSLRTRFGAICEGPCTVTGTRAAGTPRISLSPAGGRRGEGELPPFAAGWMGTPRQRFRDPQAANTLQFSGLRTPRPIGRKLVLH